MKLYLFGGAEKGEARAELGLIEKVIKEINPKQVLHIPFARVRASWPEWKGDWFHRNINLGKIEYLKASRKKDMLKVKKPLIFISGGSSGLNLLRKLSKNKKLLNLIKKADYIVGESAGSKAMGEYQRVGDDLVKGIGILKNTLVEGHYSQRKRQKVLLGEMQKTGVKYGIGIDTVTAMVIEVDKFPKKYTKIGKGKVELKKRKKPKNVELATKLI
jgi:hypothetical protein